VDVSWHMFAGKLAYSRLHPLQEKLRFKTLMPAHAETCVLYAMPRLRLYNTEENWQGTLVQLGKLIMYCISASIAKLRKGTQAKTP